MRAAAGSTAGLHMSRHRASAARPSNAVHRSRILPVVRAQATSTAPTATAAAQAVKADLQAALQGVDRGIFGLTAQKKATILGLVSALEQCNPVGNPTQQLDLCAGRWRLLFSTITITGVKRTKLGLREFIRLGDFIQEINVEASEAVNVVDFNVSGLSMAGGALTIRAAYTPSSPTRVDIKFKEATLKPPQLQKLFEANYDLLLSVFNPEGWLEITYLDDKHRVGRDDKGNVFLLERAS